MVQFLCLWYGLGPDGRLGTVKHLCRITKGAPNQAVQWMSFVCFVTVSFNSMFSFFGATSPFLTYVEDKCDIPQAE